jgi:predicted esterase
MALAICGSCHKGRPIFPLPLPGEALTRQQAEETADFLWKERLQLLEAQWGQMWNQQLFELRGLRMPLYTAVYGEKPADGRSLYISMHGGGDGTAAQNDEQWNNQKTLYDVTEGVYIAPRAAQDSWDMWFQPYIDTLFTRIIRMAMIKQDVNPNKVYILGYSAGGDGVYRLAPRMADNWAAAMMAAGHPGDTSPLNLRNIGFTLWMGADDSQYNRNQRAIEYGQQLDALQAADPGGYIHDTHIVAGKPHWLDNLEQQGFNWLGQFRRNPYPGRIVWRQEASNPRQSFYYLSVPRADAVAGREVRVDRSGNTITIVKNDYPTLYINLNDKFVDLDKPVVVMQNGQQIFSGVVSRKLELITLSIEERLDPNYIFSAALKVTADGVSAL